MGGCCGVPALFAILACATACLALPYSFNKQHDHDTLCSRAGRPLLLAAVGNGLSNQRWQLLSQLATARKLGWTFVAGQVLMEFYDECKDEVGFVPFSTVFSLDALLDWGTAHNVTIATDVTPELQVRLAAAVLHGSHMYPLRLTAARTPTWM